MSRYSRGVDVLGDGIMDMIPIASMFSKGGDKKDAAPAAPSTAEAIRVALEQERIRRASEKAEADAAQTRLILFGVLGALGVGGLVLAIKR